MIGKVSHDVIVRDSQLFNNRRQGVSIVGARRIAIKDNVIHNIKGTPPQFGVDVEATATNIGFDRDIIIQRNEFNSNRGGGVTVQTTGDGIREWPKGPEPEDRQFYIHDNTCIGCGMILRGSKVGPNIQRNKFGGHILWFIDVENLVLVDNEHVGSSAENCFSIKFQRASGQALDNKFNNEPIIFPLKPSTLYNSPYNCPFVEI